MQTNTTPQDTDIEINTDPCADPSSITPLPFSLAIAFLVAGIYFGVLLTMAQVISLIRIQEMFHFQSFHMYGVIGSAIITGAIGVQVLRYSGVQSVTQQLITIRKVAFQKGQILGGLIFGIGWALTGACPGPIFAVIGSGYSVFIVILVSALAGTWVYGKLRNKLPH
jgi:uncharacterized membrane protein YedE/YeeE